MALLLHAKTCTCIWKSYTQKAYLERSAFVYSSGMQIVTHFKKKGTRQSESTWGRGRGKEERNFWRSKRTPINYRVELWCQLFYCCALYLRPGVLTFRSEKLQPWALIMKWKLDQRDRQLPLPPKKNIQYPIMSRTEK